MALRRLVDSMLTPHQRQRIKAFVSRQLHINARAGLEPNCELPYKVLVGTHHKTGTVWLHSIFKAICAECALHFFAGEQAEAPPQWDVLFQRHSRFDVDSLGPAIRGLHIIRDPRDIIISGCFYHQKSEERWLHSPRRHLGGRSYQQAINSRGTLDDKILFEMENTARETIEEMMKWDYTRQSFYELKYEDLIRDSELMLFHSVFSFLGFPGSVLPGVLGIAYRNSLFSGQVTTPGHVRSGETAQWRRYFGPRHKERFLELFGDVLIRLGYEENDDWTTMEAPG